MEKENKLNKELKEMKEIERKYNHYNKNQSGQDNWKNMRILRNKAKEIAERNEFKGGCGVWKHGSCGKEIKCETAKNNIYYCPECQAKKEIQEISESINE